MERPSSSTTRDPVRRRAADHLRGPGTSYHAMTVIADISVVSPLDGGGLYALRAGRCGCDSLSLAGSRQRVKSLRSAVRLRLVIITARSILSRRVFHSADAPFHTHLPRARRKARLFLPLTLQSQTRRRYRCAMCLCPVTLFVAAVSSLVTQRLSAFRSFLATAYRLCCTPRLSAESSEPSNRQLLRR